MTPRTMQAIRHLHGLAASRRPVYVIEARHARPASYFGAVPARESPEIDHGRSCLIAFETQQLALDVARGLEHHKRLRGRFPPPACEEVLELDADPAAPLTELDVREMALTGVMALVRGSGMGVSIMFEAEGDTVESVDVRPSAPVCRLWLDTLWWDPHPARPAAPAGRRGLLGEARTQLLLVALAWFYACSALSLLFVVLACR